jgi:hypothetical protein
MYYLLIISVLTYSCLPLPAYPFLGGKTHTHSTLPDVTRA